MQTQPSFDINRDHKEFRVKTRGKSNSVTRG